MRLHVLHCGGDLSPMSISDPFDEDPGRLIYSPALAFLIEHPAGTVLFDSGYHERWQQGSTVAGIGVEVGPEDHVVAQLSAIGVAASEVDLVVLSHLHCDHAGGLRHFPHAPVLVQAGERAFAARRPAYQEGFYDDRDTGHGPSWRELDGELDLFGDGSIVILPTPGHTPGHQSALVTLPSGAFVLAGDVSYQLAAMRQRHLSGVVWAADATVASWELIEGLERSRGAQIMLAHDLGFRETMRLAPEASYP